MQPGATAFAARRTVSLLSPPVSVPISEFSSPDRVAETAAYVAEILEEIKRRDPDDGQTTLLAAHRRLRDSICEYAAVLRQTGQSPDQIVKHTKFLVARTMREVELYPGCLMETVVAWAIEGYHRPRHSVRQHGGHVDAHVSENRVREPFSLGQQPHKEVSIRNL